MRTRQRREQAGTLEADRVSRRDAKSSTAGASRCRTASEYLPRARRLPTPQGGPIVLSSEYLAQAPAHDLVFVAAHHPDGDEELPFARPLDMDRRICREQPLSN